jgi:hypothetical protein
MYSAIWEERCILGRVGSKALYEYDFGDSWEHSIVLEKQLPVDPNMAYPVCADGQLACPPEDCGGIPGSYDLVDALNDPNLRPVAAKLSRVSRPSHLRTLAERTQFFKGGTHAVGMVRTSPRTSSG